MGNVWIIGYLVVGVICTFSLHAIPRKTDFDAHGFWAAIVCAFVERPVAAIVAWPVALAVVGAFYVFEHKRNKSQRSPKESDLPQTSRTRANPFLAESQGDSTTSTDAQNKPR